MSTGFTLWLTGLSGAGKSTLARLLEAELKARGLRVEVLDGDEVRQNLSQGLGFSKADRDTQVRRIGYVARLLTRNGVVTIVAAISPYRKAREEVRAQIGRFIEIYVQCPLRTCIERDVKGLYKKALAGEIQQFTGISDPYEPPDRPEIVVDTSRQSPDESLQAILAGLEETGYLPQQAAKAVSVS
ncbi:MAG: adenylyl-sulfate kinase [Firmicutes bacterium]|jgi:adenylyl-sulfate kinase|nr:adenylyl-sulfate kinase [Bacillota bacterium]